MAEYEKPLLVPPFNKKEIESVADQQADQQIDDSVEYILFQFHDDNVAGGSPMSAEFEITKFKTDKLIAYLNKSLKDKGITFTLTRENFSTDFETLVNSITGGLSLVLGAVLLYATNVICGDMDVIGNGLTINAFGGFTLNYNANYTFTYATQINNCSINKARN